MPLAAAVRCSIGAMRYVALLRGINVGGNNMVPMVALKACFETQKLRDVATYIQSGNVVFATARATTADALTTQLEAALEQTFGFPIAVVVRSADDMQAVMPSAPAGFGAAPDDYRYDVLFLKPPLTVDDALQSLATTPRVDRAWPGPGVIYFSRLTARAAESQLGKFTAKAVARRVTVRNWNTTTRLAALVLGSP